jgi:hypothetical protein
MTSSWRSPTPYIVPWSHERLDETPVIASPSGGIAYRGELPYDRDSLGVLWARRALRPGKGRPEYGAIHPQRQRNAMGSMRCQVCAGPADENENGWLWLLDVGDGTHVADGEITTHPPVCVPCAGKAIRLCPAFRDGHVLVRVKDPTLDRVHGTLYRPGNPIPVAGDKEFVHYTDPKIRWVLAGQLVATLHGCTPVEDDELLAIGGLR